MNRKARLPRIALYAIDREGFFSAEPIADMHHLATRALPRHDGPGFLAVHRVRVSPRVLACRKAIATALRRAHHYECACTDVCGHWQLRTVAVTHDKRQEWLVTTHHFRND